MLGAALAFLGTSTGRLVAECAGALFVISVFWGTAHHAGYAEAEGLYRAKIAAINDANQRAIIVAQRKAAEDAATNAGTLKAVQDRAATARMADGVREAGVARAIAMAASKEATAPPCPIPDSVMQAVRGGEK